MDHKELMTLIIGYTCVGVFVTTAVITVLSLIGVIKIDPDAKRKLYEILIFEIVVIGIGLFGNFISINPKPVEAKIETLVANNERLEQTAPLVQVPEKAEIKPRIYFHIKDKNQRDSAQKIADQITKDGSFIVPGIQMLDIGPTSTELRYFKKSEEQEAKQIGDQLTKIGLPLTVRYIPGFEDSKSIRPRHYELWIAS